MQGRNFTIFVTFLLCLIGNGLFSQNTTVSVKLKILMQGCYSITDGQMSVNLRTGNYLPLTSPYCEDLHSVTSIPTDISDWVLVQLRSSVDGPAVASKSALLRRDGRIVADDGTTTITMDANPGNYYVIIKHRNHLPVMTASMIALTSDAATLYDFTIGENKCYGTSGVVELEPTVWGMWAGDINQDGMVTSRDYKIWFESERAGSAGYLHSEVNLDGVVNDSDYSIWLDNAKKGAISSIPILNECSIITDIDGNKYKTVKIGNQWWMAENLKVTHYRNGEMIPYVIGSGSWAILTTGAYCYYDYRDDLGSRYGGLYNWYAVNDSRGLAPEGWHIPSDAEWQTLKDYLSGDAVAGGKMKETGEAWASPNTGATNESKFSALPGGEIDEVGTFRHSYSNGKFWYSSDFSNDAAWYCSLYYAGSYADRTGAFKRTGISVRCVRY